MIKEVDVINYKGEVLEMVLKSPEKSGLNITDISGIGPETVNINIDDSINLDGGVYNSSKKPVRNIVFSIKFMFFPSVEDNRHKTYKYFPLKKEITLIFITDTRKLYISGRVESNTPNIFSSEESCQISILCPDPYFKAVESTTFQNVNFDCIKYGFEFPVSKDSFSFAELEEDIQYKNIVNIGDIECPTIITLTNIVCTRDDDTTWYNKDIIIENILTGETFKLKFTNTQIRKTDKIIISSERNNKSIFIYDPIEDVYRDVLFAMNEDSDWINLLPGNNYLYCNAATGDPEDVTISYNPLFEGV